MANTTYSDRSVLTVVEQWFYFDDSLSEKIESWCAERCYSFAETDPNVVEHSLEHGTLFSEYCALFTDLVEGFLSSEGIAPQTFYSELRKQLEACKSNRDRGSTFAHLVLSSLDFNTFYAMMHDVYQGKGFAFIPPLVAVDDDDDGAAMDEEILADAKHSGSGRGGWSKDDEFYQDDAKYSHK